MRVRERALVSPLMMMENSGKLSCSHNFPIEKSISACLHVFHVALSRVYCNMGLGGMRTLCDQALYVGPTF